MKESASLKDKVFQVIATIMAAPPSSVTIEASPKTIRQWDSLKHMNLILAIEEAFGVSFSDDEVVTIEDARTLIAVLEQKGAN
jgi:acyl carrier protein